MSLGSLKNVINKMFLQIIDLIYMYEEDLALNNLQWMIYYKTNLPIIWFESQYVVGNLIHLRIIYLFGHRYYNVIWLVQVIKRTRC